MLVVSLIEITCIIIRFLLHMKVIQSAVMTTNRSQIPTFIKPSTGVRQTVLNPVLTPFQCGICQSFYTSEVDILERHIEDTHRRHMRLVSVSWINITIRIPKIICWINLWINSFREHRPVASLLSAHLPQQQRQPLYSPSNTNFTQSSNEFNQTQQQQFNLGMRYGHMDIRNESSIPCSVATYAFAVHETPSVTYHNSSMIRMPIHSTSAMEPTTCPLVSKLELAINFILFFALWMVKTTKVVSK